MSWGQGRWGVSVENVTPPPGGDGGNFTVTFTPPQNTSIRATDSVFLDIESDDGVAGATVILKYPALGNQAQTVFENGAFVGSFAARSNISVSETNRLVLQVVPFPRWLSNLDFDVY